MKMNSSVMLGAIIAVAMFSTGMVTYRVIMSVQVMNFPLDKNGNLKISVQESSKIMLVYNQTLTLPPDPYATEFHYLTTFNTSGFTYCCIMAKAQGSWQSGAGIWVHYYESNYGILVNSYYSMGHFNLDTAPSTNPGFGSAGSPTFEVRSPSYALYVRVGSGTGFDGRFTIIVHLTN